MAQAPSKYRLIARHRNQNPCLRFRRLSKWRETTGSRILMTAEFGNGSG